MAIGKVIAETRDRLEISQREFADRVPSSREAIAKYETGERKFPDDLVPAYCEGLNDAIFIKQVQRECTNGVYIPYLDGPLVDHHPASLIFRARKELKEAKEHLGQIDSSKPLAFMTDAEIDHIKRTIHELLDAAAASETLVIDICSRFDFSYNDTIKQWIHSLTARQLKARQNV
ncbi:helix-turn-helix transcriptional regulator [Alkalihalobacillus sp. LMS39]|uniref:helix-turn-helix domain-containing protein n=1 Tax=Alkalihalobacillus sp. LMS39 TaxID=2924032 RepID=UPI001FB54B5F|nr:helix-turn-helix transcriptional regulator [Alkalihalobacillus sp. LMS39]UOE96051.1 helix-turn-helix transcriptional regulator [Alkalihalobacillus sp. LMS39]